MHPQKRLFFATLAAAVSAATAQSPVCGGIGWTGPTTCASGSGCVVSNPYYSQCIPGASPTSSTPTSPSSTSSALPFVGGVNTAGYDFSVATNGSFTGTGVNPPTSQFAHFASQGANIFRIPWQLMTPTLGGTIDPTFFARYDATVQSALSAPGSPYVIVDVHNYARWNGGIIAQGGPTNNQFTSLWSQLAQKYANNPKVIFGIMNEPHDLDVPTWANTVQLAVNAIRSAGATENVLLLPGSSYTSAQAFPTEAGPYLLKVTDPGNTDTSKLVFDVHKYLDSDNSGTHADCVTNNVNVLTTLVSWLKSNGNRQALLSETGGGNTSSCETDVGQELAYIKQNSDSIVGFVMWAAGAFDTTYTLTLTPNPDGSDQSLWTIAVKPNLP
ncbi:endoglucanase [Vararia minispora EC-137]|uniref:Endoglucanase n=1 Tax=Vararia minispora EC-137 TaxID=1314806 RepID=A0ACB8QF49_9AGAM|nr:endoglucanase [Vararia minispora EC-137]